MNSKLIDLNSYTQVDDLWSRLVDRIGLDKAKRAISQAVDLRAMNAKPSILSVLFFETCGLALVSAETLSFQADIPVPSSRMVLIASLREKTLQLLNHI